MTARETKIAKRILDALHALDGGQAHEITIHAEIGGLPVCTSAELEETLRVLDAAKLITGIRTKFRGVLWNISSAGEAARLEM